MSLFAQLGQGDFWGKGFTFSSPVNDLLDRGNYSLAEILDEDDLLQEIKAMNTRLIDFLSQESTMEELVTYLVDAPEEGSDDKRTFKYPYVACEVICCEVDAIVDSLAGAKQGALVERLFSILDSEGDLDDHLSGYFEKVLFVLLKRKCLQIMGLINRRGLDLFKKFVSHLNKYSIMQVVERLFLYQPGWDGSFPGAVGLELGLSDDEGSHASPTDLAALRCSWGSMPEVAEMLVEQLVEGAAATHTHVAELLLTVVENSGPDSSFIKNLMGKMPRLLELAIPALDFGKDPEELQKEAVAVVKELRSSMMSALTIVEALLSRPQTLKMQWDMAQHQAMLEGNKSDVSLSESFGGGIMLLSDEITAKLRSTLPALRLYLKTHETDEEALQTQVRQSVPKLGMTRLKLVRHVEALVKMCSADLDGPLEKEGVLEVCLEMFFKYEWTSVLHQSVTRIVTWIMDAGPLRLELQSYLVKQCKLLELILKADEHNEEQESLAAGQRRCRRGYMGHLFIMAQAVMDASRQGPGDDVMGDEQEGDVEGGEPAAKGAQPRTFANIMEREIDPALAERWNQFVQGRLAHVTAAQCQPLGGYAFPSRADENKLTQQFGEQGPDFDQVTEMLAQRLSGMDLGKGATVEPEDGRASLKDLVMSALHSAGAFQKEGEGSGIEGTGYTAGAFGPERVVFTLDEDKGENLSADEAHKETAQPRPAGGLDSTYAFSAEGFPPTANDWAADFDEAFPSSGAAGLGAVQSFPPFGEIGPSTAQGDGGGDSAAFNPFAEGRHGSMPTNDDYFSISRILNMDDEPASWHPSERLMAQWGLSASPPREQRHEDHDEEKEGDGEEERVVEVEEIESTMVEEGPQGGKERQTDVAATGDAERAREEGNPGVRQGDEGDGEDM